MKFETELLNYFSLNLINIYYLIKRNQAENLSELHVKRLYLVTISIASVICICNQQ